jgi:hypothetical protein
MKQRKKPLPPNLWNRGRKGRVVCQCGMHVGSEYDGLCYDCRGGVTAFEAKLKEKNP